MNWKETMGHALWQVGSRALPFRRVMSGIGLRTCNQWYSHRIDRVRLAGGNTAWLTGFDQNYCSFQLFWCGWQYYQPATSSLVLELTRQPLAFIDIGANIGYYAMTVAAERRRRGVVGGTNVAFEPNPKMQRILRQNILNNGFAIQAKAAALSDVQGACTLSLAVSDMDATLEPLADAVAVVEVPATTLDDYAERSVLAGPALIKIDTCGHEQEVIAGATQTLSRVQPDLILTAKSPLALDRCAFLEQLGYRFHHVTHTGLIATDRVASLDSGDLCFPNVFVSTRDVEEIDVLSHRVAHAVKGIDMNSTSNYRPRQ